MSNDDDMFDSIEGNNYGLEFELPEVFGSEFNTASSANTIASSNSSDNNINNEDNPMVLGPQILSQWEQR